MYTFFHSHVEPKWTTITWDTLGPDSPIKTKRSVYHWTSLKLNIDLHGTNSLGFILYCALLSDVHELCWIWISLRGKIQNLINDSHCDDKDLCLCKMHLHTAWWATYMAFRISFNLSLFQFIFSIKAVASTRGKWNLNSYLGALVCLST